MKYSKLADTCHEDLEEFRWRFEAAARDQGRRADELWDEIFEDFANVDEYRTASEATVAEVILDLLSCCLACCRLAPDELPRELP